MTWKNLWLYVEKTSNTPRTFRSKPTIKAQSLEAMFPATKFGWTVNTSKTSRIGSWRLSSLDRSKSYNRWGSRLTSLSYQKSGESMMFSTCHCWSRTPLGRNGWTRQHNWISRLTTTRSTKWKKSGPVQCMQWSRKRVICQGYTT